MEHNKDMAIKAKEIAEKLLAEKDILKAKHFATKAQSLYPGLEDVEQFIQTLDVYVAAQRKANGEVDWYKVLGVHSLADNETIRRSYKRLALALHPDKNKAVGADGAFKLLSEAWTLLSDQVKRAAYDEKQNLMGSFQNVTVDKRNANEPSVSATHSYSTPFTSNTGTFWTQCTTCLVQFQYTSLFRNFNLFCHHCRQPFLATEIPLPPVNDHPTFTLESRYTQKQGGRPGVGLNTGENVPQGSSFQFGGFRSMSSSAAAAGQTSQNVHPMGENLKGGREEAVSGRVHEELFMRSKNFKKFDSGLPSYNASCSGKEDKPAKKRRIDGGSRRGNQAGRPVAEKATISDKQPKSLRQLSASETRDMLMAKAKMEIRKKLEEWKVAAVQKPLGRELGKQQTALQESVARSVHRARNTKISPKPDATGSSPSALATGSKAEVSPIVTMDVPDSEFYDFDGDRVEQSFTENQVWAAYDNEDGMPRFYAVIHEVICRKPFKLRISWLNSKSNTEFSPRNWVGCGFLKTSGIFRTGKHEVNTTLNSFSHRVSWIKGAKGVIQIFPKKGDVWALYRNWSSDWNDLTPIDVIRQYDMVEVLEDYNAEHGVVVAPLVKTAGFRSVFHQHLEKNRIYTIPREEIFRLSHQVASYLLTGQEAQNAPKGCHELDTAAMPLELLQVLKESKEDEGGKAADEVSTTRNVDARSSSGDYKNVFPKPLLVYSRRAKGKKVAGNVV